MKAKKKKNKNRKSNLKKNEIATFFSIFIYCIKAICFLHKLEIVGYNLRNFNYQKIDRYTEKTKIIFISNIYKKKQQQRIILHINQ